MLQNFKISLILFNFKINKSHNKMKNNFKINKTPIKIQKP